jgi:hypothetical protein
MPVLDLAGKHSRKKPPLQAWQAYSILKYRPKDSPLRVEVVKLFEERTNSAVIAPLIPFFPSSTDFSTVDFLTFLSAYMRERCTHLTAEEQGQVEALTRSDLIHDRIIRS